MKKGEILDKVYKSKLPSRAKQVMFYLINRANAEGTCFPSVKTIASDCGVSERTIQRTMNILIEEGLVIKEERYRDNGGQSSNLYKLQIGFENNDIKANANEKRFDEEKLKGMEVKEEEKNNIESIKASSFEDYIESKLIETNNIEDLNQGIASLLIQRPLKHINFISKGKCHPVLFYRINRRINNLRTILTLNSLCHGVGDNLYPP